VSKPQEQASVQINWQKLAQAIDFTPTDKQRYIIENTDRFNTIVGGKRVGKSKLIAFLALLELLKIEKTIWVVAPQYALGKVIWGYLFMWANKYLSDILKPNTQFLMIKNKVTGSTLELKSADNEKSLKGVGLDLLIVDEAGDVGENIWNEFLRPNIAELRPSGEKGRAFLIGNSNYFGSWWHQMVENKEIKNKFSYHLPTVIEDERGIRSNNPEIITKDELEEIKRTTPTRDWNQQYKAAFVPGQGTVFQGILECATGDFQAPRGDRSYYIGVDLGRLQDFTVITVIDAKTWDVVYWDRFNQIDYSFQKKKILAVVDKFGKDRSRVVIDQTGLGQPIVDDLERKGISVEGIRFSNESKKDLIERLSLHIEQKKISYPEVEVLIEELQVFSYTMSKTGKVVYNAPSGFHDDAVISLALAAWNLDGEPQRGSRRAISQKEKISESRKSRFGTIFTKEISKTNPMPRRSYV